MKFGFILLPFAIVLGVVVSSPSARFQSTSPQPPERPVENYSHAQLIAAAKDSSAKFRIDAILELGVKPGSLETTVPLLAELTMDRSELVRSAAGLALGDIGPEGSPYLKSMFESDEPSVLSQACTALKELGGGAKPYLPKLEDLIRSDHAFERKQGLIALQGAGSDALELMEFIIDALDDPDFNVQCMACRVLETLGPDAIPAEEALLRLLKDGNPSARSWAAIALGVIGPTAETDTAKLLASNLDSHNHLVKQRTLIGIAHLGPEASSIVEDVRRLAHDKSKRLMPHAAYALYRITDDPDEATKVLKRLFDNPTYRDEAIEIAGQMGPAAAPLVDNIAKQLNSPEEVTRELALIALGKMGPAAAKHDAAIKKLFGDPDPLIRNAARQTIEQMKP